PFSEGGGVVGTCRRDQRRRVIYDMLWRCVRGLAQHETLEANLAPPPGRPQPLACGVGDDAIEPRGEGLAEPEAADAAKRKQEAVLHDVLGQGTIRRQQLGQVDRGALIARDEALQSGDIALLAEANGIRVGVLGTAHTSSSPRTQQYTTTAILAWQ